MDRTGQVFFFEAKTVSTVCTRARRIHNLHACVRYISVPRRASRPPTPRRHRHTRGQSLSEGKAVQVPKPGTREAVKRRPASGT